MSLIIIFTLPSLSLKINIIYYIKIALVHDMAKALIKDIILMDGVKRDKKN
jgi:5'-deoxynucleotidase YfbR-like HD superfamily hydrolase